MYEYVADVRDVYDGDTIRADIDLGFGVWLANQSIRLLGIDTPELRGETYLQAIAARDALREKILGKSVTLKTQRDKRGKYGRWLATVYVDGLDVNSWLIANGFARVWPHQS